MAAAPPIAPAPATPAAKERRATAPSLRLVADTPARHTLTYLMLYVLLIGGTVFAAVSLNAMAASRSLQAHTLEREVTVQERDYAHLLAEVARLEAPSRIRAEALQMGLVVGGEPTYLFLERQLAADEVVGEVAVGGEADRLKPVLSVSR